jgi:hypothetical protein
MKIEYLETKESRKLSMSEVLKEDLEEVSKLIRSFRGCNPPTVDVSKLSREMMR